MKAHSPGPTAPTVAPPTVTAARLTRCTRARTAPTVWREMRTWCMDEIEDVPPEDIPAPPPHVDGALMISFGAVHPGREALAVETFTALSRYLGRLMVAGLINSFTPYFLSNGY